MKDKTHDYHLVSNGMTEIISTIESLNLPEQVKEDILNIYTIIAEAESKVHNRPVDQIHFHEVGSKDAIMDIAAACLIIRTIAPDKIYASPICTGSGFVKCAHGVLPVPTPATAYILEGIPTYAGDEQGELCTPTGAAILKYFVDEFTQRPLMKVEKTGYGFGKKNFKKLNCLRAYLGHEERQPSDQVILLQCNLDDITGEEIGFTFEKLLKVGALDVYITPIYMKKDRPGFLLNVLTRESEKDHLIKQIFKLTTTIGIREFVCNKRYTLDRTEINYITEEGVIREKISKGYGVERKKFEFDDLNNVATNNDISIRDAKELIEKLLK